MKKIILSLLVAASIFLTSPKIAEARASVRGYFRRSTYTYVAPHYRTSPNSYKFDNWSSRGNYNPYTGAKGYKSWY